MRLLWTVLSVLAVANMLALLGFFGWLAASDRLDTGRIREVRTMFHETLAQKTAREEEARKQQEQEQQEAAARAHAQLPPLAAATSLELRLQKSQADDARLESMRREIQILQDTLRREREALGLERAQLEKERADFDSARRIVAETDGDAQFKKTLATIEALKPDKARLALGELIKNGKTDQAVSYLNAMQERARTRILDEFLQDDPKLATDLLERLRTRGLSIAGS